MAKQCSGWMTFLLAAFIASPAFCAEPASGPLPDVPELAVLANYIGSWKTEMSIRNPNQPDEVTEYQGTTEARWILSGRYVEQTTTLKHEDEPSSIIQVRNMLTYDPKQNVYRTSQYLSTSPEALVSEGTWDPQLKTMTLTAKDENNGNTIKTKADFSQPGLEHWVITVTNEQGEVGLTLEGKNVRKQ